MLGATFSVAESLGISSTTFTQNDGHKLRRSGSFKVTDFDTNRKLICDFLLMINTNLPPVLHRFRDIHVSLRWVQNRYKLIWLPLLCLTAPAEGFPWDDLRKIFCECQWMATVPNAQCRISPVYTIQPVVKPV